MSCSKTKSKFRVKKMVTRSEDISTNVELIQRADGILVQQDGWNLGTLKLNDEGKWYFALCTGLPNHKYELGDDFQSTIKSEVYLKRGKKN